MLSVSTGHVVANCSLMCDVIPCVLLVKTHNTIDAALPPRPFRKHHQVGLDAALPQVVAALSSVPSFHVKLAVKTLQGAL